jgi:hypothetical protein
LIPKIAPYRLGLIAKGDIGVPLRHPGVDVVKIVDAPLRRPSPSHASPPAETARLARMSRHTIRRTLKVCHDLLKEGSYILDGTSLTVDKGGEGTTP